MSWTNPPRTWVADELVGASLMNAHVRDQLIALLAQPWTTYTPAWTASSVNPAIGNGVLTGHYKKFADGLIFWKITVKLGSTTTLGTGTQYFTLPVAPVTDSNLGTNGAGLILGRGFASSVKEYSVVKEAGSSTRFQLYNFETLVTAANAGWVNTITVSLTGTYQGA